VFSSLSFSAVATDTCTLFPLASTHLRSNADGWEAFDFRVNTPPSAED